MASKRIETAYEEFMSVEELAADEQELVAQAWTAREFAHAPYSNFKVGAAVQTKDHQVFQGSNQENATFDGTCAERVALYSAGSKGNKNNIHKIAIVGGDASLSMHEAALAQESPVAPCGRCRQDLKDTQDLVGEPITIILASRTMIRRFESIDSLLPFGFGSGDLGVK